MKMLPSVRRVLATTYAGGLFFNMQGDFLGALLSGERFQTTPSTTYFFQTVVAVKFQSGLQLGTSSHGGKGNKGTGSMKGRGRGSGGKGSGKGPASRHGSPSRVGGGKGGYHKSVSMFFNKEIQRYVDEDTSSCNILPGGHVEEKASNLEGAEAVLSRMKEDNVARDVVTYTTLLRGYVKAGDEAGAEAILSRMKGDNVVPDVVTCNTLLSVYVKAGRSNLKRAEAILSRMMVEIKEAPNVVTYNTLLSGYVEAGDLEGAEAILTRMKADENKVAPNVVTYSTLLSGYGKAGNLEGAEDVLRRMKRDHVPRNVVTYNTLLSGYVKVGNLEGAEDVLQRMKRDHVPRNVVTYNTLRRGYLNISDLEGAEAILTRMTKDNAPPDVATYGAVLDAYAKRGDVLGAFRVFQKMKDAGLEPDVATYTMLIGAHARNGDAPGAYSVLPMMRAAGLTPNALTYTALVDAFAKSGDVPGAWDVFKRMIAEGVAPNVGTYNVLIQAYARNRDELGARRVFQMMRSADVAPDVVTYNTLVGACAKSGNVPGACDVLPKMRAEGVAPNVFTYNALVDAYAKKGDVPGACRAFKMMAAEGVAPDVATYNVLIQAYARNRDELGARCVFQMMKSADVAPNVATYNALVGACATSGNVRGAYDEFQMMIVEGIAPNVATYHALLDAHGHAADAEGDNEKRGDIIRDGISRVLDLMEQDANVMPSVATFRIILQQYARTGRTEQARELLREMEVAAKLGTVQLRSGWWPRSSSDGGKGNNKGSSMSSGAPVDLAFYDNLLLTQQAGTGPWFCRDNARLGLLVAHLEAMDATTRDSREHLYNLLRLYSRPRTRREHRNPPKSVPKEEQRRILGQMLRAVGTPDKFTFGIAEELVVRYLNADDTDSARRVLEMMHEQMAQEQQPGGTTHVGPPKVETYNKFLFAYCGTNYQNQEQDRTRSRRTPRMPASKTEEGVKWVLDSMLKYNVDHDALTYYALISRYLEKASDASSFSDVARRIKDAEDMLEEIRSENLEPTPSTYRVVLKLYALYFRAAEAEQFQGEASKNKIAEEVGTLLKMAEVDRAGLAILLPSRRFPDLVAEMLKSLKDELQLVLPSSTFQAVLEHVEGEPPSPAPTPAPDADAVTSVGQSTCAIS